MQVVLIWFPRIREKIDLINFFFSKQREMIYAQQTRLQDCDIGTRTGGKTFQKCPESRGLEQWMISGTGWAMGCQTQQRTAGQQHALGKGDGYWA